MVRFTPEHNLSQHKNVAELENIFLYCLLICGAALLITLCLLDAIQKKAIKLIGDPPLSSKLSSLAHHRAIGDLSLVIDISMAPENYVSYFHLGQFWEDQLCVRYECISSLFNYKSPEYLNYVFLSFPRCPD